MRLIMGVSGDGYVTRRPHDDMSWLGATDKKVFRLLTGVGGEMACGRKTWHVLPVLEGRRLTCLRTNEAHGTTLLQFHVKNPDGWLIGGQQVAVNAIAMGLIHEAHICVSARLARPEIFPEAELCILGIAMKGYLSKAMSTTIDDTRVEVWRRG